MDKFQLLLNHQTRQAEVFMHPSIHDDTTDHKETVQKGFYDPVRPLALQRWVGFVFVAALIGAMVYLSYLKDQETRLNGWL